jgi:hypothetical protein
MVSAEQIMRMLMCFHAVSRSRSALALTEYLNNDYTWTSERPERPRARVYDDTA